MTKRFFTFLVIILVLLSVITLPASAATNNTNNYERRLYSENGELIADVEIISKLEKGIVQTTRGTLCCDDMKKVTIYDEHHVYIPPTPAWCTYDRYKLVMCDACGAVFSYEYIGQYSHVHQ